MQRFLDPELFPNDLIADYHQTAVPLGFKSLYRLVAWLGIKPLLFNQFIPILLGIATTAYCFGICLEMLPIPVAGFVATVLMNQNLWGHEDIISGTPRAFLYPFLLAFLYYLLRRSLIPLTASIILLGLFYPPPMLIVAGMLLLQLVNWRSWPPKFSHDRRTYILVALGIGVTVAMLLPYLLGTSEFGPTLTLAEAQQLPELGPQGRKAFFLDTPQQFWIWGLRSGILPSEWYLWPNKYFFLVFLLSLFLPILFAFSAFFPLTKKFTPKILLIPQLVIVSLFWYFAAHTLLFKLYLPSRFTQHSLRIITPILASFVLLILLDKVLQLCQRKVGLPQGASVIAVLVVVALLVTYPVIIKVKNYNSLTNNNYHVGEVPSLYQLLNQQPKDIMVASLAKEANNIPTYALRSVLIAGEYSNPYQSGYYQQFRQRMGDLIQAQYSQDISTVARFIKKYDVDFWLLDESAFTSQYFRDSRLLKQFLQPGFEDDQLPNFVKEARENIKLGNTPALVSIIRECTIWREKELILLEADCLLKAAESI
ncbi:MAG: hypothetical protein WA999_16685, partial [Spirulinaceae cyanobacterium]